MTDEPPEPFKSALIDACKSLVPTLKDFTFRKVSRGTRLRSSMRVLVKKEHLTRPIRFTATDMPKESGEVRRYCYIDWRF